MTDTLKPLNPTGHTKEEIHEAALARRWEVMQMRRIERRTFKDIGNQLGVTGERARHIYLAGLRAEKRSAYLTNKGR